MMHHQIEQVVSSFDLVVALVVVGQVSTLVAHPDSRIVRQGAAGVQ